MDNDGTVVFGVGHLEQGVPAAALEVELDTVECRVVGVSEGAAHARTVGHVALEAAFLTRALLAPTANKQTNISASFFQVSQSAEDCTLFFLDQTDLRAGVSALYHQY